MVFLLPRARSPHGCEHALAAVNLFSYGCRHMTNRRLIDCFLSHPHRPNQRREVPGDVPADVCTQNLGLLELFYIISYYIISYPFFYTSAILTRLRQ